GLPPVQHELETLFKTKLKIAELAGKCEILIISHYHYDHYDPNEAFYKGKKVFAKDIEKNINKSQKQRGTDFKKNVENICDLEYCDDSKHQIGNTRIIFSPPFFHGPENVRLGYVIMTTIDDSERIIVHSSDVQGPVTKSAKEYIIDQKPDLLIMDGPPTIFLGWKFSKQSLQDASDNLVEIINTLGCQVILDHHLLRDLKYLDIFSEPYRIGKEKIKTFAEYLGKENNTLEAHRKELWSK
ncbi:MAG: hypothetical protein KAU84_03935, partial [Thermoplasmatales archaeon]|nr:hypothetical protein [Thermoplasmatales archaeon]